MKYEPLEDRVLVRRLTPEQPKSKLIIIPEAHQELSQIGEVIAVGPGRWEILNATDRPVRIALAVKVGDQVLIGKYAGVAIEGSKDLVVVRENEILVKVKA